MRYITPEEQVQSIHWMEGKGIDITYEIINDGCQQPEESLCRMQLRVTSVEIIHKRSIRLYVSAPHRIAYVEIKNLSANNINTADVEIVLPNKSRAKHVRVGKVLSINFRD